MTSRPVALTLVLAVLTPGVATATPLVGAPVGSPLRLLRSDLTARRGGPVLPRQTFRNRHGKRACPDPRSPDGPRLAGSVDLRLACNFDRRRSREPPASDAALDSHIQPQMTEPCRHVPDCRSRRTSGVGGNR